MPRLATGRDIEKAWAIVQFIESKMREPGALMLVLPRPDIVEIHTAPGHALPDMEFRAVKNWIRVYLRGEGHDST